MAVCQSRHAPQTILIMPRMPWPLSSSVGGVGLEYPGMVKKRVRSVDIRTLFIWLVRTPIVGCTGYVCTPFHNPKQHIGAVTLTSYALCPPLLRFGGSTLFQAGNQTAPYETDRAPACEDSAKPPVCGASCQERTSENKALTSPLPPPTRRVLREREGLFCCRVRRVRLRSIS
jgi:hypothetical protein